MPLPGRKAKRKGIPVGLWTKCKDCGRAIFNKSLRENLMVCPRCSYHFILSAQERINILLDPDSFVEYETGLTTVDILDFKGVKTYKQKLKEDQEKTGLTEACVVGRAKLDNREVAFGVTDARFIMGSMGSVVGEKITRLIEMAIDNKLPLIIVSGSGGGARMYEGMFSLMQMAKTSTALNKYNQAKLPFMSILTNPTMAGVMASFASLGDVIIAEPGALVGFTGPRIIEQTIRQRLPEGFQTSEFLLQHGLIDMVVDRRNLKQTLNYLLSFF